MGLDMYLTKRTFVGGNFEHLNVQGTVDITVGDKKLDIDLKKVSYILEEVGYWRKANQVHGWLVREVQEGVDECQESYVAYDQLVTLRDLCKQVIEENNPELLPTTRGFFFGGDSIDEHYYDDLKKTVEIIDSLTPEGDYYYRASW